MSPHVKTSDHIEAQDEVKLLEKKSSDSSMSSYSGIGRRGTEISIYICEDGHRFNCDDIPKSTFDTTYLKSITSFQAPPKSKVATCCFVLAILAIVALTTIALIAGVYLRSQEATETVVAQVGNKTIVNLNITKTVNQGNIFSLSESPGVSSVDNIMSSPSSVTSS